MSQGTLQMDGAPHAGTTLRGATFSPCGRYRYTLRRCWADGPLVAFIGLNPSTADATEDDPTIRRCVGFARSWGFGALVMLNLFAWRGADPDALLTVDDPIGPANDQVIAAVTEQASLTMLAWGAHRATRKRAAEVVRIVEPSFAQLGLTKDGHPRHPLYVKGDVRPMGGLFQTPASLPIDREAA